LKDIPDNFFRTVHDRLDVCPRHVVCRRDYDVIAILAVDGAVRRQQRDTVTRF